MSSVAGPSQVKPLPPLKLPPDPDRPTSAQLSALFKEYRPEYDTSLPRKGVERCRITCKQTEAQRLAGQEADCKGWCYLNYGKGFKEALRAARRQAVKAEDKKLTEEELVERDRYWPSFLEGKYLFWFRGKKNVHNQLEFQSYPSELMVLCYQVQQEKWDKLKTLVSRENLHLKLSGAKQKYTMSEQTMGIISPAETVQSLLQRFRAHNIRIFSPGLKNIAKIPTMLQDGTYLRVMDQVWTAMKEGKALELGQRMLESTGRVLSNRGKGGESGGVGPPGGAGGAV